MFKSLTAKTLAVFIPLVVIAELTVFGVQSWVFYSAQQKQLRERLSDLVTVQRTALSPAVWEYDTEAMEAAVEQLLQLDYVTGVAILDDVGEEMVVGGAYDVAPEAPDYRAKADIVRFQQGQVLAIGAVEITVTGAAIRESLIKDALTDGIVLLALLAALVGSAAISTRLFVGRPLALLRTAIEDWREGRDPPPVKWDAEDELGDVVRAFNAMQARRAEAENKFQQMAKVFRDGSDPMVMEDLNGTVIDMNREAELAYGWTREELIGKPIKTIVPKDRADQAGALLTRCRAGEDVRSVEGTRITKDGREVPVLLTLTLLKDDQGAPASIVSIAADISALKEAETELRTHQAHLEDLVAERTRELEEREERFRGIFETSAAGMALMTMDGAYIQVNRRFCEILGYGEEEILGMNWRDVTFKDDIKDIEALDRAVEQGQMKDFYFERRMVRADGSLIWTNLSSSQMRDADDVPVLIFSYVQDITDLKSAEEAVRENERNLRNLLDSGPVGIGVVSQESHERLFGNKHLVDMMGASSVEELISMDFERTYVDPGDLDAISAAVSKGESVNNVEVRRRRIDGEIIWCLQNYRPIGKFLGKEAAVVWLVDITELKHAEEEVAAQKAILDVALDNMDQGLSMFDADFKLEVGNKRLLDLLELPEHLGEPGTPLEAFFRYNAENGEYGEGDVEEQIRERVELARKKEPHRFERTLLDGRVIEVKGKPVPTGGFVTTYTDITEILAAQRDAKLLKEAMDTFADMVILYDREERVIFTNDRYHEIYPNAPSKEEIRDWTMEGLLRRTLEAGQVAAERAKTDPEGWLRDALAGRRSDEGGSGETVHNTGRTFFFRYGRTTEGGMILLQTDITDRKRLEETLRERELVLSATIDNISGGVMMCDGDLNIRLFNRQFEEALDLPEGLVREGASITETWLYQLDRGDYGKVEPEAQIRKLSEIFEARKVTTYERELATGKTLEMRFSPMDNGGGVWIAHDITARKKMMAEIQRNERQFRRILEDSPVAVAISNDDESARDGTIEFSNARFKSMLGVLNEDMGKARTNEFFRNQETLEFFDDNLKRGDATFDVEAVWHSRDGRVFTTLTSVSPIEHNGTKAALTWIYDVSEQKRIQEEITKKEAQLRMALDNMPGAMQVVDPDMKVVMVNDLYVDFYGDPEGLLRPGASMIDILRSEIERGVAIGDGDVEDVLETRLASYYVATSSSFEDRTEDGRHILLTRNPAPDGHTVSVAVDITERKKAEQIIANAMALINESIQYASRIQRAILPTPDMLSRAFQDHFTIWEPKDAVGGDIILLRETQAGPLLCVIDCTGHGLPGGFMTVVATGAFDQALTEMPNASPSRLMLRVNTLVKKTLSQDQEVGESDDGLECGVCLIDIDAEELVYAGARFDLWLAQDGEIIAYRGDKAGLGYRGGASRKAFSEHRVPIQGDAAFYITSDGMIDQVGGASKRTLGKKRLKEIILAASDTSFPDQADAILDAFLEHQGGEERRDDITMVGFVPHRP